MNLTDCLDENCVLKLADTDKSAVLGALSTCLAERMGLDADRLLQAVLDREELMSTGIGQELAVPHVRLAGVSRPASAVAVCPDGVRDYPSLDERAVRLVVLILCPPGQHETYIRLLASTVEALRKPGLKNRLLAANEPADIVRLLKEARA